MKDMLWVGKVTVMVNTQSSLVNMLIPYSSLYTGIQQHVHKTQHKNIYTQHNNMYTQADSAHYTLQESFIVNHCESIRRVLNPVK